MSPVPLGSPAVVTPTTAATPIPPSPTAPNTSSGPGTSPNVLGKKSSKTCCTCRARKVRCDGRRDVCSNCERLGFSCSYDEFNAEIGAGLECVYRPTKRTRLGGLSTSGGIGNGTPGVGSGNDGQSPASGGDHTETSKELDVRSPRRTESQSILADPLSETSPNNSLAHHDPRFPPEDLVARILDSFFRHLHHIPMVSFLHRASLMQRHHAGLLDKPLLLAIVGLTSLLIDMGPGIKQFGVKCIDEAESLILSDLEKPSTVKVQSLCLIIKHRALSRRFSSSFMLIGVASRFATVLRLNHEQPHLCFLAQESRRRLMWALFMIDSSAAGGYEDFTLWKADQIRLQLPCNERNFEFDLPQTTEGLVPPPQPVSEDLGNLALHIRIFWLRSKVISFGKRAIRARSPQELAALPAGVSALAQELESFNQRLPLSFRYNENNLRLRMYSPRLCVFVMVHIWWRQCHLDLFRLSLGGLVEALPKHVLDRCDQGFLAMCQRQCVEHATAMSNIFSDMLSLDTGIPVTDIDFPVCAYQCARLLHYAFATAANELSMSADDISERAERCLRAVKASCNETPAVVSIQGDLERLIRDGLSAATTPSNCETPGPEAEQQEQRHGAPRGEEAMSRHSMIKQMDIVDDSGIGAPPAPEERLPEVVGDQGERNTSIHSGGLHTPVTMSGQLPLPNHQGMDIMNGYDPDGGLGMDIQPPVGKHMEIPMHGPGNMPIVDLTAQNNAFEGAADPMSFNMEPFGLDSLTWFSSEWLNAEYPQQQ
ncbi:hypothetical protein MKZ38_008357 [Zalerion maritima]|uniref:Zn(2)-C6 fungal-type domain-containing protein n=1 Tax=Zalerion maritima TaxID=339359 RepID=A0AAD5RU70_9PEZI|nr:hypothetical protein MKZ38_008357 [Zalerion maritima]